MKKILLLLSALVMTLCCSTLAYTATVKADNEDYVLESYLIEVSDEETMLPVPDIPSDWTYSIVLKSGETILAENIHKYLFTQTGEYTLVYTIHKNGSLTDVIEETAVLHIADMTKPELIISGDYEEEYFVGDELIIQTAQVKDNVDKDLTASVELYFGEEKIAFENSKYVFKRNGEYRLIYKAIDAAGNESVLIYEFMVLKKDKESQQGCGGVAGGISALLSATACMALIMQKRKIKNNREE